MEKTMLKYPKLSHICNGTKKTILAVALATALCTLQMAMPSKASSQVEYAGYDQIELKVPHYTAPLRADIWYPVATITYKGLVADNAIFQGVKAYVGAAIEKKKHPLVVISHGSGGAKQSMAWLASSLAKKGALVLVFNHPGSTSGDSSPRRSIKHWTRPKDVSAILDAAMADKFLSQFISEDDISAAGFSLGGATVLSLAGARTDLKLYQSYCDKYQKVAEDCIFFAKGGVDYSLIDPDQFSQDLSDPRIKRTIALDPGMTYGMIKESIEAIKQPILVVSLGDDKTQLVAADVSEKGSALVANLSNVRHVQLAPASHFTALPVCKPNAAKILQDEEDDPICTDPVGTDRADIHRQIADVVADFLSLSDSKK
jgi:predicted dienelactone hydrolase